MSKRNPGSFFRKPPSSREVEAVAVKRREEERKLVEKMNIPPRDEVKYPMPNEKDLKNAGAFIYTLVLLAESYDGNLKALIWDFYVDFMNCMRKDSTQEQLHSLIGSLTILKEYLAASKNPLFTDEVPMEKPMEKPVKKPVRS